MSTRLLIVGDMHLGRRPHRLAPAGLSPEGATPVVALSRLVKRAVNESVDAVLFAGDLVDRDDDIFEAYSALEAAAKRLLGAGVRVLAIAGNHDARVLPRLVNRVDGVELLGRDGRWETTRVNAVAVVGWSFPASHHPRSPLESKGLDNALAEARDARTAIGLLHADLDATRSAYAPVARRSLAALELDAWFVGHVHRPDKFGGTRHVGYLGSLVGLGRGEPGPRGPWSVTIDARGRIDAELRPVGPLIWVNAKLDITDSSVHDVGALREAILQKLIEERDGRPDDSWDIVAVQLEVVGDVDDVGRAAEWVRELSSDGAPLRVEDAGASIAVVRLTHSLRPRIDLSTLCSEPTALGVAARLVRDLESGAPVDPALRAALDKARTPLLKGSWHLDDTQWPALDPAILDRAAAWQLVRDLLTQRS